MTLEQLKAKVAEAGYTASAGCWESEYTAAAFSVETWGAATMNASKYSVTFCKLTGRVTIVGRPIK